MNEKLTSKVCDIMASLNRIAAEVMQDFKINACTDVTGFGLLGHACEMIEDSNVGLRIFTRNIPLIDETLKYANMGMVPAGTYRNKKFRADFILNLQSAPSPLVDILFDPQTSGGLLIAVDRDQSDRLVQVLREREVKHASIIGEFMNTHPSRIILDPPDPFFQTSS